VRVQMPSGTPNLRGRLTRDGALSRHVVAPAIVSERRAARFEVDDPRAIRTIEEAMNPARRETIRAVPRQDQLRLTSHFAARLVVCRVLIANEVMNRRRSVA